MSDPVEASELARIIRETIQKLDTYGGVVSLDDFGFDRVPCTRRKLYAVARKYAGEWGYDYNKAEYIPSGNRPFQRNHKRGRLRGPYLSKIGMK